jgi:hypothetical protein
LLAVIGQHDFSPLGLMYSVTVWQSQWHFLLSQNDKAPYMNSTIANESTNADPDTR